jgi:hypothetical protein
VAIVAFASLEVAVGHHAPAPNSYF